MLYFNSCPKCLTGAIEYESDSYGGYIQCLHCGFLRDLEEGVTAAQALALAKAELAKAAEEAVA